MAVIKISNLISAKWELFYNKEYNILNVKEKSSALLSEFQN